MTDVSCTPALTISLFLLSLAAASFLPSCVKSSMSGEKAIGIPNTFLQASQQEDVQRKALVFCSHAHMNKQRLDLT